MDQKAIKTLVCQTISEYVYEAPLAGSTIGVPWSEEKVLGYVEKLRAALVEPYLQRFELRETYEQVSAQFDPSHCDYWVVAEGCHYLEWFDPLTGDFGLACRSNDGAIPVSIGARGDLVGVYCSM